MVRVANVEFGGREIVLIAGPCAVESRAQIQAAADCAVACGAQLLRGGGYKVRTSATSFQGLGLEGYRLLHEAAAARGLLSVSEVLSGEQVDEAVPLVDVLQVGTRSMQSVPLLKAAGRSGRPVLLKRGFGSRIDEWLAAAEYILNEGNPNVVLCERGIRTFETATRFTLDVAAIPIAKERTGLPVIVDPSHASGDRRYVTALTLAGIAAGADGVMLEVHPSPEAALSDGPQSLTPDGLRALVAAAAPVAQALGRTFGRATSLP